MMAPSKTHAEKKRIMAAFNIGSVVKIDDSTVKAFAEAMGKKSEPIQVANKNMIPLTDFSIFKHVK